MQPMEPGIEAPPARTSFAAAARLAQRKILRSLRHKGYRETARLVLYNCWQLLRSRFSRRRDRAMPDPLDLEWGTDTAQVVEQGELEVDSPNHAFAVRYQATPPEAFQAMMAALDIRFEDYTFVDIGSGKGRALLLAADYPFRAIAGVEFSPLLHRIAADNIEKRRPAFRACRDVASIRADAAVFQLPQTPLVLYFYHPFDRPVMEKVAENIRASLAGCPRSVYIVYFNPVCGDTLERNGQFAPLHRGRDFTIYRN